MSRHRPSGGFWQAQGVEEVELSGMLLLVPLEGAGTDMGGVFLDAGQKVERGSGACGMALCFQAHAHDAVEDEDQEADHGVRADAVGEPVMNRRGIAFGTEDVTMGPCV